MTVDSLIRAFLFRFVDHRGNQHKNVQHPTSSASPPAPKAGDLVVDALMRFCSAFLPAKPICAEDPGRVLSAQHATRKSAFGQK